MTGIKKYKEGLGLLLVFLGLFFCGLIHAGTPPYIAKTGPVDGFKVNVTLPGIAETKSMYLIMDSRNKATYESARDAIVMGDIKFNYVFTKVWDTSSSKFIDIISDRRNYDNYYVDFPLSIVVENMTKVGSQYKVSISTSMQNAATFVELIDKQDPDRPLTNMLEGNAEYTFTVTSGELIPEEGTSRFRTERLAVRVYGAELPVTPVGGQLLDWNNPSSWILKRIPTEDSHVVIPKDVKLALPSATTTIDMLSNYGKLEIATGASLTVLEKTTIVPEN